MSRVTSGRLLTFSPRSFLLPWCLAGVAGIKARHEDVNIVLIRESTEGEYSGESRVPPNMVNSTPQ